MDSLLSADDTNCANVILEPSKHAERDAITEDESEDAKSEQESAQARAEIPRVREGGEVGRRMEVDPLIEIRIEIVGRDRRC